jgi:hypothetical protein
MENLNMGAGLVHYIRVSYPYILYPEVVIGWLGCLQAIKLYDVPACPGDKHFIWFIAEPQCIQIPGFLSIISGRIQDKNKFSLLRSDSEWNGNGISRTTIRKGVHGTGLPDAIYPEVGRRLKYSGVLDIVKAYNQQRGVSVYTYVVLFTGSATNQK